MNKLYVTLMACLALSCPKLGNDSEPLKNQPKPVDVWAKPSVDEPIPKSSIDLGHVYQSADRNITLYCNRTYRFSDNNCALQLQHPDKDTVILYFDTKKFHETDFYGKPIEKPPYYFQGMVNSFRGMINVSKGTTCKTYSDRLPRSYSESPSGRNCNDVDEEIAMGLVEKHLSGIDLQPKFDSWFKRVEKRDAEKKKKKLEEKEKNAKKIVDGW